MTKTFTEPKTEPCLIPAIKPEPYTMIMIPFSEDELEAVILAVKRVSAAGAARMEAHFAAMRERGEVIPKDLQDEAGRVQLTFNTLLEKLQNASLNYTPTVKPQETVQK